MSRNSLAVVLLVATSLTGCAVCDTCDDFPTPCIGPNCGGQGTFTGGGPNQMMPLSGPVNPPVDAAEMAAREAGQLPPNTPTPDPNWRPTPPVPMVAPAR